MTMLARHGGLVKHQHQIKGINSRLDGMQAAILSAKTAASAALDQGPPGGRQGLRRRPQPDRGCRGAAGRARPHHVYHLYTIKHPRRDALAAHLNANGVQTAVNYPTALPFLAAYSRFKRRPEQFPNAHHDQDKILSLPMFAEITREQQDEVIRLVREF
jgi:dTDP-4-amino-4,6-dideoxygalactose transaminase